MPWTVELADEFADEFNALPEAVQDELLAHAKLLEQFGPTLGRPTVDTLKGSKHSNLKELRFDADNGVWRTAFAFDPQRHGVLLAAGDKSGTSEKRFYRGLTATADSRLDAHLERLKRKSEVQRRSARNEPTDPMEETMGRTLAEMIRNVPPERRKKIERRAAELIADEMSLRELRRAMGRTQIKVAKDLGIGQEAVSRLEGRTDMLISTLDRYVRKAGGRLKLVVEFPNRKPVKLKGLGDITPAAKRPGRARSRPRQAERASA